MHFTGSEEARKLVTAANCILLNVHRNPDLDSVGSSLAMRLALQRMGKHADIVGPHRINPDYLFLNGAETIRTVDYADFDAAGYDLMVVLDSGSDQIVTGNPHTPLPSLERLVVDHHKNNSIEARLKIIDEHASSTCEMLYHLFNDWRVEITPELATLLFAGACHDTMFFKYNENETDTFRVASELISKGADKAGILFHVFNNMNLEFVKNVGRMLEWIRIEKTASGKSFACVALNFEEYQAMGAPFNIREYVADSYLQSIKGTLFGIVMVEEAKGKLSVSFRGKEQSDMSALARLFNGGGHKLRAGATLYGSNFNDLVNQVVSALKRQA